MTARKDASLRGCVCMFWWACAVPVHLARLLSQWKPRVTAASGIRPVTTTALDEFKHLCQQWLSSHSFGILTFVGHSSLKRNQFKKSDFFLFWKKSYMSFTRWMFQRFICYMSQRDLTFYFDCSVCIWCHVKCINTHVFPRIIRPWFSNSMTKYKTHLQYFITLN